MDYPDDQQPVARVVGRRRSSGIGHPLDATARDAMTRMAQYRTHAPKGVYYYDSHEQMEADRLRWTVEAMVQRAQQRQIRARD